jgi:hypothetical protein
VPFKLISDENKKAVFENPEHDFPQRVIYVLNADGSMTALVEGKMRGQGEERRIEFQFNRVR